MKKKLTKKMGFFTELSNRWNQESPPFFDKLKSFGKWLSATGIALIGIPAAFNTLMETLNVKMNSTFDLSLLGLIASWMVLAGLIITVFCKTTIKDGMIKS